MTPPAVVRRRDLAAIHGRAMRVRRVKTRAVERRKVVRLWLPLTPVFWLLAPFGVLLSPFLTLAPPFRGTNSLTAAGLIGGVLVSLGGTEVHVDAPDVRVRIKIL